MQELVPQSFVNTSLGKAFCFHILITSVLNWLDVLWWNDPSLPIFLLQQLIWIYMWIYSVSLCNNQCSTFPNRKNLTQPKKSSRQPITTLQSPTWQWSISEQVVWNASLRPRVKFHNPSMTCRSCKLKTKQKTPESQDPREESIYPNWNPILTKWKFI